MAHQTVCDFCEDSGPLHPKTGRYELVVRKFIKFDEENGSQTTQETEYDICGACMQKIRLISPTAFPEKKKA